MTTIVMILIVIFMACELTFGMKPYDDPERFFDVTSTKAFRGFWFFVVLLVHIPKAYQNTIQDLIGSFAYIGVTYFFMTSGYGLMISHIAKPDGIRYFWRKRLPRILLTNLFINIVGYALVWTTGAREFKPWQILIPDYWIIWLYVCYLAFWLGAVIFGNRPAARIFTVTSLIVLSLTTFFLKRAGYMEATWETEVFGFIWGMLLALYGPVFYRFIRDRWYLKTGIICVLSMILGVTYLKFKSVIFVGDYLIRIVLGIAITLFVLAFQARFSFGNRVSLFLGEIALEVFLIHMFIYNAVETLAGSEINSGSFIAVSIIAVIVLAYLCHLAVKPVLGALMITGNRALRDR